MSSIQTTHNSIWLDRINSCNVKLNLKAGLTHMPSWRRWEAMMIVKIRGRAQARARVQTQVSFATWYPRHPNTVPQGSCKFFFLLSQTIHSDHVEDEKESGVFLLIDPWFLLIDPSFKLFSIYQPVFFGLDGRSLIDPWSVTLSTRHFTLKLTHKVKYRQSFTPVSGACKSNNLFGSESTVDAHYIQRESCAVKEIHALHAQSKRFMRFMRSQRDSCASCAVIRFMRTLSYSCALSAWSKGFMRVQRDSCALLSYSCVVMRVSGDSENTGGLGNPNRPGYLLG
jgi:hypothetical protein